MDSREDELPPRQRFAAVVLCDFEFEAPPGERPRPLCMVVTLLPGGRTIRLWRDELEALTEAPFDTGPDTLFVAFYASAELGCFLSLGWPLPRRVLDLFAEFRCATNGRELPCGNGLLGAAVYYGLDCIAADDKAAMQALAQKGAWTPEEQAALLAYCESDVILLAKLLPRMLPGLDLPRAVGIRGRYMLAAARIEHAGSPIDAPLLEHLQDRWPTIRAELIARVDQPFGVYDGETFKIDRFEAWLAENNIPWPRTPTGRPALDDDTFKDMAKIHPVVQPLRELLSSMAKLRMTDLPVGADERNRTLLSVFASKTGRNQPSTTQFIFGTAAWLRFLLRAEPDHAVAYLDWSQQEFGIAAALSNDPAMMLAYESGDPYLAFAKQAGAVPQEATKESHGAVREQYKQCVLAVQYGMAAEGLAVRLGTTPAHARLLLEAHRRTYPRFWQWSDSMVDHAMFHGRLQTVFGWNLFVTPMPLKAFPALGPRVNARSLRNFPMQANGAEMLRLACCFATERGVRVCAPVHDALLIEAHVSELDEAIAITRDAMREASRIVLDGFELRSDSKSFVYPERYSDERGVKMWETVVELAGPPALQPRNVDGAPAPPRPISSDEVEE